MSALCACNVHREDGASYLCFQIWQQNRSCAVAWCEHLQLHLNECLWVARGSLVLYLCGRDVLTYLGPSFIKAGQVLANRPDIVREDYMNELCGLQVSQYMHGLWIPTRAAIVLLQFSLFIALPACLAPELASMQQTAGRESPPHVCAAPYCSQDDVPSFSDELAFSIMEQQLGRPVNQVFSSISERPIAAASLGQVGPQAQNSPGTAAAAAICMHDAWTGVLWVCKGLHVQAQPGTTHACMHDAWTGEGTLWVCKELHVQAQPGATHASLGRVGSSKYRRHCCGKRSICTHGQRGCCGCLG